MGYLASGRAVPAGSAKTKAKLPSEGRFCILAAMPQDLAIRTIGLSKTYGSRAALDGLDLSVPSGSIFGFLGRNGAGKTTTIRLLAGLAKPSSGDIEFHGRSVLGHGVDVRRRFGYLLEDQGFYPRLSGRENLRLFRRLAGVEPTEALIDSVTERVGLAERSRHRVGTYSHGMKQRLSVAAALLVDPAVLILDEPTNGLDPPGIRDFRDLMRGLRDEGMTIFLSSHLLSEVERLCDWVCIIDEGRRRFHGLMSDLPSARGAVLVKIPDPASAARSLSDRGWLVTPADGGITVVGATGAEVNQALAKHQIFADVITEESGALEDSFFALLRQGEEEP